MDRPESERHPQLLGKLKCLPKIYRDRLFATKRSPQEPKAIAQLQNWQTITSTKAIAK